MSSDMNDPFFESLDLISNRKKDYLIPQCGVCGLHKTCESPKMPYSGEGRRKVLIVGEAPGYNEDKKGLQFVGDSGSILREKLKNIGIDIRKDCWLTNALICRPPNNKIENNKAIDYCRPNLLKTLDELKPISIILLGGTAISSLIEYLWKSDIGGVNKWLGWNIPSQKLNSWICPTYHPSFVLRNDKKDGVLLHKILQDHLEKVFEYEERPWKAVPDYRSRVECLYTEDRTVRAIEEMMSLGEPLAFDYETNTLKPDSENSQIVCCSIASIKKSISFPWMGKIIPKMQEFLFSSIPKIGQNIKFEEKWTIKEFGHGVNNWYWDDMIASHVIDNRPGITSIKFQSFVLLGADSYNDDIEHYLLTKGGNIVNRIKEIPMEKLLLYCGLDSLYERLVADIQMEKIK